jgi:hypothetical protein
MSSDRNSLFLMSISFEGDRLFLVHCGRISYELHMQPVYRNLISLAWQYAVRRTRRKNQEVQCYAMVFRPYFLLGRHICLGTVHKLVGYIIRSVRNNTLRLYKSYAGHKEDAKIVF